MRELWAEGSEAIWWHLTLAPSPKRLAMAGNWPSLTGRVRVGATFSVSRARGQV